jgi:mRNA interferase MazF
MHRAEVWWADLPPPAGRRPVVLVSREKAVQVRAAVLAAQVTTKVRGIPTEVPLGSEEGLPKPCVVNADVLMTIEKGRLVGRVGELGREKRRALDEALRFALGL